MKRHSQPRLGKGLHRERVHSAVDEEVKNRLDAIARRYSVSRSWVEHTILADAVGVRTIPYQHADAKRRRTLRVVRGGR